MRWHLARLLLYVALLIIPLAEGNEEEWSMECPISCSCHLSHFRDLPMRRWLTEESTGHESNPHQTYEYSNEVMYADDTSTPRHNNDDDNLMKMAICIIQKGNNPEEILSSLPTNLEVLTILQSPDSDHNTLGANVFQNLPNLVALEIQGFYKSGSTQVSGHHSNRVLAHLLLNDDMATEETVQLQEKITLLNDALLPLTSLLYLNLQYVKLQGGGRKFHDGPRPFLIKTASYKYDLEDMPDDEEQISHKLVFLAPDPEGEVLPYRNYNEELEYSGISMFNGLPNLVFLRIYGCGLKDVNWEMFDGLTSLEYLSLENNELRFIPEFTFYGTPNLKIISLAHNKLLSLQSTSLAGLLELKKLDLSHNNFSHLSELSLPPFPHLKTADFRHNPIETVFSSTFEIMNATEILYLGGDETEIEIRSNSFSGLDSLLKLYIHNVRIQNIERNTLIGMPKLKELEIQGSIDMIDFDAFLEVPKLEKLTLKNCHLKTVSMDAFYGLYNLLYLDLSDNLLETLPPGVFDQQFSLKELHLQNNKFQELPEDIFKQISAKMIRLEGNPWHCSCSMMSWRETSINKVKERIAPVCQFKHDKGSSCHQVAYRYVYEKRVAPQCETPVKYKNWSVFYVLRKVFRCKKFNWKNGEMKQTKYPTGGEEYQKNKNVSKDNIENKNSSQTTNDDETVDPLLNVFNNETDRIKQLKGTEKDITEKFRKMTKDDNEGGNFEGKVITTDLGKFNSKDYKTLIIDNILVTTTSPNYNRESKLTTIGKIQTAPNNDKHIAGENKPPTTDKTKIDANDNSRSNSTSKAQFPQTVTENNIREGKSKPNTGNEMENQEENGLYSLISSRKNAGELNSGSLNNRFSTNRDNDGQLFSEKSTNVRSNMNGKNSHQPVIASKTSEQEYIIFDGKKNIKVSRKAFKLEMERQKKEKLRTQ